MDALKAEIVAKRKAIQHDPNGVDRPTKYMRRGDVERLREEQELKNREERLNVVKQTTVEVCRDFSTLTKSLTREWRTDSPSVCCQFTSSSFDP